MKQYVIFCKPNYGKWQAKSKHNLQRSNILKKEPKDWSFQCQIWQWSSEEVSRFQSPHSTEHPSNSSEVRYLRLNYPNPEAFPPLLSLQLWWFEDPTVASSDQFWLVHWRKQEEVKRLRPISRQPPRDVCAACLQTSCRKKVTTSKMFTATISINTVRIIKRLVTQVVKEHVGSWWVFMISNFKGLSTKWLKSVYPAPNSCVQIPSPISLVRK